MAETKEDEKWSNQDDCSEETIVTGSDARKKVIQSPDKQQPIIRCIGELSVEFRYVKKYYQPTGPGTATVFHVTNNNKKAFAITAAHCVRSAALECTQCDIYMATKYKNNNNKIVKRRDCKNCYSSDHLKDIILNATTIIFTRNEIKPKTTEVDSDGENVEYVYGDPKQPYRCKLEYIPDSDYIKSPHPKSGYDYAIIILTKTTIILTDNYPYKKYSEQVFVENIQTKLANKQIEGFRIFGYPYYTYKKTGMVGHKSTGKEYTVKVYEETKQYYLEQKEVDTTIGQSGSVLWFTINSNNVMFAIHTGGSNKFKYNVATIINDTVVHKIKSCTKNGQLINVVKKWTINSETRRTFQYSSSPNMYNKIKSEFGMVPEIYEITLYHNGKPIQNLNDYDWNNDDIFELKEKRIGGMQIFVKGMRGRKYTFYVATVTAISFVKYMVHMEIGWPMEQIVLMYSISGGCNALKDSMCLGDYNIQKQSTLYMIPPIHYRIGKQKSTVHSSLLIKNNQLMQKIIISRTYPNINDKETMDSMNGKQWYWLDGNDNDGYAWISYNKNDSAKLHLAWIGRQLVCTIRNGKYRVHFNRFPDMYSVIPSGIQYMNIAMYQDTRMIICSQPKNVLYNIAVRSNT